MRALDYILKDRSEDYISSLINKPNWFYWAGSVKINKDVSLGSAAFVLAAYMKWRRERFDHSIGVVLGSFASSGGVSGTGISGNISGINITSEQGDDLMIEDIDDAVDDDGDNKIDDGNQQQQQGGKPRNPTQHDQIKKLMDKGITYDELISDKNGRYEKFNFLLLRYKRTWTEYEASVQRRKKPLIITSIAPTARMLAEYGLDDNDIAGESYGAKQIRIFLSWFIPNFVTHSATKGEYILWLWSKKESCGKTSLWRYGINAIGQKGQVLQTEPSGWFQSYKQNHGTYLIIDGYTATDKKQGVGISFLERIGSGLKAILPKRNLHIQPYAHRLPLLITSNSHWRSLFTVDECNKKLTTRIITIEASQRYSLFNLIDLILRANGKPPRPSPTIRQPADLRILL